MDRRKFLGTTAAAGVALVAKPLHGPCRKASALVAEPVHSTGYLPMYIAMANNYFAEADIEVKIVTIETGGGHTNAVLSGQAFAFIGGPEHNAYRQGEGRRPPSGRAIASIVATSTSAPPRARIQPTKTGRLISRDKSIALGPYGGTPNSIMRFLLTKWNLDAKKDVTLLEVPNSAVPATVRGGRAAIGVTTEPMITQGVKQGFWGEPFLNVPKELGPYAYSTINMRLELGQERAGGGARLRSRHDQGPEIPLCRQEWRCRDRQEAVPNHGAGRLEGHARPFVRRRDVEHGRNDQPRRPGTPGRPW